jgi:ribonuclease HII
VPWIVGIDEAGYGPNLGPFVMSSVACRLPDGPADLWRLLDGAVRRDTDAADGRLLVADSKVVYNAAGGLRGLETAVLAFHGGVAALAALADRLCPQARDELAAEAWYTGRSALPVEAAAEAVAALAARLADACREQQVAWGLMRSVVICPARFNRIVEDCGSKGGVLGQGLIELLQHNLAAADDSPMSIFVDKHGGRNSYAAMLQQATPGGFVVADEESTARSRYHVLGLPRAVRVTLQPRADGEHFCVALASMISKYLRELLMLEFNRFWLAQVPGLKPTAGYPADAPRFWAAIRPAAEKLGLPETAVWRQR